MSALTPRLIIVLLGNFTLVPTSWSAAAAEPPVQDEMVMGESLDAVAGLRAGDWLVRGRLSGSIPTESRSHVDRIGGRIDTPAVVLPDCDVSYFITDHIAIEVQAGAVRTRPFIRASSVGDIAIGSIWNAAAMAMAQYHILPSTRFNPYLGFGLAATTPLAIAPATGIPNFQIKSQFSGVIQIGFDYHIFGKWFANAMVKYVFVPKQSYEFGDLKVEADLNTLIIGAGLGYRF